MSSQILSSGKRFLASVALVISPLLVDPSYVLVEIASKAKLFFAAVWTLNFLESFVHALEMRFDASFSAKTGGTQLALKLFHLQMDLVDVLVQIPFLTELGIASLAFKVFFLEVN